MDDPSVGSGAGGVAGLRDAVVGWVRRDARRTLITAAVAFGVAWFANVYIIAVRYEGTGIPPGGAATVSGNRLTGVIFWVVMSAVVLTIVGYAQQVGWSRTGAELRVLPSNLRSAFQAAPTNVRWAAFAWGAAVSLVVAALFSTAAAAALGVGVLVIAASPLVATLGRWLRKAGAVVLGRVAGDAAAEVDSGAASTATVLGAAAGMAVAWQVGPWTVKLGLALIAAFGAAVLLKRDVGPAAAAALLLALLAAAELRDLLGAVALADDGGWQEGGGTLTSWIGSQGSGRVMTQSVLGGLSGSFGAVAGSAAGSAFGSAVTAGVGAAAGATVAASGQPTLAMGGLSGEFAAAEAGVTPKSPPVAVAPREQRPADAGTAHDDATGAGRGGAAGGGDPTAADGDLAVGGLSGEFGGDASDATGRRGVAPGRSDQTDQDAQDGQQEDA